MAMYSKVSYWDKRYNSTSDQKPYEWYQGYSSLRHLLNPIHFSAQCTTNHIKQEGPLLPQAFNTQTKVAVFPSRENCRVLILGCGNSSFGEDMQKDGWTGPIVNVDFSQVVIDQMKNKYNDMYYEQCGQAGNANGGNRISRCCTRMEFLCCDITERLPFDDQSFDLIVCKGSFDAVLCSATSRYSILKMVRESFRLLARGHGIFFLVTHGNPDSRVEYLEHQNNPYHYWHTVNIHPVNRPVVNPHHSRTDYVYICRKRADDPSTAEPSAIVPSGMENAATTAFTNAAESRK